MFDSGIAWAAGALAGIAVLSVILSIQGLLNLFSARERQYMDAPPPFAIPIWPLVLFVNHFVANLLPDSRLNKIDQKLQTHGVSFMLTAEEYFSVSLVLALIFPLLGGIAMASSGSINILILLGLALLGVIIPSAWIRDAKRKRDVDVTRNLPVYLEYLSMCVDAGLNFSGALKQAVEKGPKGAVQNEFRMVMRDINAGQTRADALRRLEQRIALKDISVFVSAVIQAEKM
ncbi:MAG: type II secretion system F family protein, partial [Oceanococcus sp.]